VDHARAPVNAYGRTKALGEELLERAGGRFLLVRTSWLYAPWGKNFVLTVHARMRRGEALKVVDDQRGRPTSAEYLARRTLALLDAGATGTFHACDGGECSWFELARWIAGRTGSTSPVQACRSAEVAGPVRPAYSVLDLEKTETLLGPSTPWQDNVARVLDRL
jgi:dTDP-4-dehydrorhamnose reductase